MQYLQNTGYQHVSKYVLLDVHLMMLYMQQKVQHTTTVPASHVMLQMQHYAHYAHYATSPQTLGVEFAVESAIE
jgi:pentose-5-phosphate-3-epimerase